MFKYVPYLYFGADVLEYTLFLQIVIIYSFYDLRQYAFLKKYGKKASCITIVMIRRK